ncbi:MAG: HAD-IA family hydrolase [Lachnospiraceae bacterium]|nr:HAD-IA family hydrolase [Candidatus Equihabitans merdae]
MWTTVIFDLDGTLTASGEGIRNAVAYALEKMGLPVPPEDELNQFIGPPLTVSFQNRYGLTPEESIPGVNLFREYYNARGIYENEPYAGVDQCLKDLKDAGFKMGIASSKPHSMVVKVLKYFGLYEYFSFIQGAPEDESEHGEKAQILAQVLADLNDEVPKDQIVYVGDRIYDIEGAHANDLKVIGVSYGYGGFDELARCGADRIVSSPMMLSRLLIEQLNDSASDSKTEDNTSESGITEFQSYQEYHQIQPIRQDKLPLKVWRVFYPMILYLVISNIFAVGVSLVFSVIGAILGASPDVVNDFLTHGMVAMQGLAGLITLPFLILFIKRDEARRSMGYYPRGVFKEIAIKPQWIIAGIIMILIGNKGIGNVIEYTGITQVDQAFQEASEYLFNGPIVLQILVICFFGPVVEELIFRGLIYRRLKDYMGMWPAIWLTPLIFAVYHMNLSQGIFAFLLGMCMTAMYEKTGKLWVSILLHITNNFVAVVFTEILDSIPILSLPVTDFIFAGIYLVMLAVLLVSLRKDNKNQKNPALN